MNHRIRSLSFAAFTAVALTACSYYRSSTSGTMVATSDRPVELRFEMPEPIDVTIELSAAEWRRIAHEADRADRDRVAADRARGQA